MTLKIKLKRQNGLWKTIHVCDHNSTRSMDSRKDNNFCVVRFIHKPQSKMPKYVIVPDSWIDPRDGRISVWYPEIGEQNIEDFYAVDPKETPNQLNGKIYLSELKHTAKNYDDAHAFITKRIDNDGNNLRSSINKGVPTSTNKHRKRNHHESRLNNTEGDVQDKQANKVYHVQDFLHDSFVFMKEVGDLLMKFAEPLKATSVNYGVSTQEHYISDEESNTKEVDETVQTNNQVSFRLPPEYDEKDSRWTLKHRTRKWGLQKLVSGYDVYIDSKKLKEICDIATNTSHLISLLLPEIFTETALATCTLIGSKKSGANVKTPGLNEDGRYAVMMFVRYWAKKKDWCTKDELSFKKQMSNKLFKFKKQEKK